VGVSFQPSLLDTEGAPAFDAAFHGIERIQLDADSWVDHLPGWVHHSDALFQTLVDGTEWAQRTRHLYDQNVIEPRLTSWWAKSTGEPLRPPILNEMRLALSAHYGVEFDSVGLNLYRDGRDSVAWHRDKIPARVVRPHVAIVSVGEPRRFLLRPRGGGKSLRFDLGKGDLLVTGGECQRRYEHTVPKRARAGPRISITFRHGVR